MINNESNFNFSVIMAVYNVEYYLKDAVDSLINQTLDFEDNIQLILVDDGSQDNSLKICQEYQKKYPNNVLVISQENGGVSSARNLGLEYATGKYINFMDSDDLISPETFKEALNFFSKHPSDDYDVISFSVKFFESWNRDHFLNYKFEERGSTIVDLMEEPQFYQCYVTSSFIKREAIGDLRFDTNLIHFEDAVFINKILMKKMKYGLMKKGVYYYRKRVTPQATSTSSFKKDYYLDRFKYSYFELIDESLDRFGYVPEFLQNMLLYDLSWIFKIENFEDILENVFDSKDEIDQFYEYLDKVLSYIEIPVIRKHRYLAAHIQSFLIYFKNKEFHVQSGKRGVFLKSDKYTLNRLHNRNIWIDIVDLRNGFLSIAGSYSSACDNKFLRIEAIKRGNGEKIIYDPKLIDYSNTNRRTRNLLAIPWRFFYNFEFKIPIAKDEVSNVALKLIYEENDKRRSMDVNLRFYYPADISEINDYSVRGNQIILFRDNRFYIENYSYVKMLKNEYRTFVHLLDDINLLSLRAMFYRFIHLILFPMMRKRNLWLFMDRQDLAGDNATHLFRYSMGMKDGIDKYFIINKDSIDYNKLKKEYGNKVVPFGSMKHKFLYLFSNKILSSHPDNRVLNPFHVDDNLKYYSGLCTLGKYFLQHGVPTFDMSSWLRKYDHNILLLLAVSDLEIPYWLKYYNFDEEIIQVLGFPRFDYLTNENMKKSIVISFTWRRFIKNEETLVHSEYYSRINSLINNERLLEKAKEKGYDIVLKMHPNAVEFIDFFEKNDYVKFDTETSFHELICNSSLMISDYSSVVYDFAYLKKPIIYYHYGDDHHFDISTSYIDLETSGFGDVVKNEDDLIDKMIYYMENDCTMEDKYKNNVDKFFKYNDKNNSKRVYDWILNH